MSSPPSQEVQPSTTPRESRNLIAEIEPGFWVGGISALKEIPKVRVDDDRSKCIWSVISIVHSSKLSHFCQSAVKEIREQSKTISGHCEVERHIEWAMADRSDSPLLCERLKEILKAMDEAHLRGTLPNRQLLVHCAFGVSRSVSVCAAWLLSRRHCTLEDAMAKIRSVRPEAMPNMGFLANLRTIEQSGGDIDKAVERQERLRKAR